MPESVPVTGQTPVETTACPPAVGKGRAAGAAAPKGTQTLGIHPISRAGTTELAESCDSGALGWKPNATIETGAASGLVISAITGPKVDEAPLDFTIPAPEFSFPDASMLDAAASFFPVAPTAWAPDWHAFGGRRETYDEYSVRSSVKWTGHAPAMRDTASSEFNALAEGPWPFLDIAPGLVRFRRSDEAAKERTRERALDRHLRLDTEGLEAEQDLEDGSPRGGVVAWSRKSRARLISTICELDISPLVAGEQIPCMVTLTAPGDWLSLFPTAAHASDAFNRFARAWSKKWGTLRCIWKREFQRRGAPHWHLWLVPPVPTAKMNEFRDWLSVTWATAMKVPEAPGPKHVEPYDGTRAPFKGKGDYVRRRRCNCSERCRSISAGTGVDFAEGMRARDPKRLAIYFLKESLGGEGKAYQNSPPKEWGAESVDVLTRQTKLEIVSAGRFWGYRGIDKAVVSVPLHPDDANDIWRTIRRSQRAKGVTREVLVQRVDTKTGVIRTRKVRRRVKIRGAAGWVALNSGSNFAAHLGAFATILGEQRARNLDAK